MDGARAVGHAGVARSAGADAVERPVENPNLGGDDKPSGIVEVCRSGWLKEKERTRVATLAIRDHRSLT